MRPINLALTNFKSYKYKESIEDLFGISVFIGPNNVGKSNIMRSLLWYQEHVLRRYDQGIAMKYDIKSLFHSGVTAEPLTLEIVFEFDYSQRNELLGRLSYHNENVRNNIFNSEILKKVKHTISYSFNGNVMSEAVSITNFSGSWYLLYNYDGHEGYSVDLTNEIKNITNVRERDLLAGNQQKTHRTGPKIPFDWCTLGSSTKVLDMIGIIILEHVRTWYWQSHLRYASERMSPEEDYSLNPSGENLIRVIHSYAEQYPGTKSKILSEVQKIIPDIIRISTPMRRRDLIGRIEEIGSVEFEMSDVSSGLIQTLILITNLFTRPMDSFLMLEEPEIHLHALAQRSLFNLIKDVSHKRGLKFIISTHSTVFAEISDTCSTYLVLKKNGASKVRKLDDRPHLLEIKQVLGHENTDLFGYNAVVMIEGDTEDRVIPILALMQGINFANLGVKFLNVGGSGKVTRIEQLVKFLKDSDTLVFSILDTHDENKSKINELVEIGLMKKEHALFIEKGFEESFDNRTLLAAINRLTQERGVRIMYITEEQLNQERNAKPAVYPILKNIFYKQNWGELSKPELGEKIVEVIRSEKQRKLTPLEIHLNTIKDILEKR
ncbi:MAG TPA: AAA family ATPase [Nitrososphaeraceae archaeon]|jgi:predicted ATP-dependent endonuclease of OLD family|nr:AAA family ATPase [Nitrososphaeraceae archaeon]